MKKIGIILVGIIAVSHFAFPQTATKVDVLDTRSTNEPPTFYNKEMKVEFKNRNTLGAPGTGLYSGLLTIAPWSDDSGQNHHQLNFNDGGLFYRSGLPSNSSWNSWTRILTTTPSGNVGIGTPSPSKELHISGSGPVTSLVESSDNHAYYAVEGAAGKGSFIDYYRKGDGRLWHTGLRNGNNNFEFRLNDQSSILTLKDDGNVGIGTTNPLEKLHVKDGVVKAGTANATQGTLQFAGYYGGNNTLNTYGSQYSSGATSIGYGVQQKHGSQGIISSAENSSFKRGMLIIDQEFQFLNAGASTIPIGNDVPMTTRFMIKENGNVGIGTTTPQSKLAVDGQIRATEVKVLTQVNSVPDYVFEPDYNLRTLKETKKYITKYKHLPEIPSASEIGENGIDLGDMNMRLLKKIEELTLYQIELLEKVEKLQEKVEKLEKN